MEDIQNLFKETIAEFMENGQEERASEILSDLLWNTISYYDDKKDFYHAFLAGIFVGRGYAVDSNKERGLGRPNIDLRDRKNRRCIIIEAKHSKSEEEMERDCALAIQQLKDNEHALKLTGYKQVLRYGVAFYQKQALIKKERSNDEAGHGQY